MGGPGMHGFGGGRGHFHFGWGGHHYVIEGGHGTAASFMMVLIFIAFFVVVILTPILIGNKTYLSKMEEDYVYYQDMISNAEADTSYQLEGRVLSKYNVYGDKYYITYTFEDRYGNELLEDGYTFSIFTLSQASELVRTGTITLAMEHKVGEITQDTDSIPLICKNYKLTDDAEYNHYHKVVIIETIAVILVGIVGFASIIGIIILSSKYKQEEGTTTNSSSVISESESTKIQTTQEVDEFWICPYCGCKNNSQRRKCGGCGSIRR